MAYLRGLVGVLCAVALAELFAPEGKQKKYVEFACALLVLSVVSAPLAKGLSLELPPVLENETQSGENAGQAAVILALEDALAAHLASKLGLPRADVSVKVEGRFEGDAFYPTSVLAEIYGGFTQKEAELVLKNALAYDCEVIVRGR
ncbi:MAG: hypothetical protein J6V82_02430 [Clostridia bacterium]|nr:hypothetical protein [Clostridia bacterium]